MRLHFVSVPTHSSAAAEDELNAFLGSHRVVAVDRQLVADGARSAWAVCVEYVDGDPVAATAHPANPNGNKRGIDYRDELPAPQFQVFAKLRDLRKRIANEDGVPPYAVFNNEQLADMVRHSVRTAAEMARIDGIGPARVEKYAVRFLEILCAAPSAPTPPATPTA